jgi:hypothetical protein
MPPIPINVEPYKDEIQQLLNSPRTWEEIRQTISKRAGQKISDRTLRERCFTWGFQRRGVINRSDTVVRFITDRYRTTRDSDKEITRLLAIAEIHMTTKQVATVRRENHLFRRYLSPEARQERQDFVTAAMQAAYEEGSVREYGREMMRTNLQRNGVIATRYGLLSILHTEVIIHRDEITAGLLALDPMGIRARKRAYKKVHDSNFRTPGPNFMWAIDGHHKLTRFGIQIYAAIDAYSRKIIWIYVGHDAVTPISVARQFLTAIRETGMVPFRVRSDRGSETPIIADIQYELRRQTELNDGLILEGEFNSFNFDEAFLFGTSMKNQRIESWWAKLQANALRPWKVPCPNHTRHNRNS